LQGDVLARDSLDLPLLRHKALFAAEQFLARAVERGELHDSR
jgi:hypothetical protein